MKVTHEPDVWIKSYDLASQVLQLDDYLIQAGYDEAKDTVFGGVLLTLDGEEHRTRRVMEQRLFSPKSVRWMDRELLPQLAASELRLCDATEDVDLVVFARRITTRLAGTIVGLDRIEDTAATDELARLMSAMHAGVTVRWSSRPHDVVLREAEAAKERYAQERFQPAFRRRKAEFAGGASETNSGVTDLLSLLLRHQSELAWSDEQYLRESVHFFIASAHTASAALIHAADDLLSWLEIYTEARHSTSDSSFLAKCAAESLRLHAPSSPAYRVVAREVSLSNGLQLHPGQVLGIDLATANRDPSVFGPDADRFDPHRHSDAAVPAYGLSFSAGAHNCPGRQLAAGTGALRTREDLSAPQGAILGIVGRILQALFEAGIERTGDPELNPSTKRQQYLSYPVRFASIQAQ